MPYRIRQTVTTQILSQKTFNMRQLILLPILFMMFGTSVTLGQVCSPVDTISEPGGSDHEVNGKCITQGQKFEGTLYFKTPDSIVVDSNLVAIDYLIVDSVKNLPCGISWATNNLNKSHPGNKFTPLEDGCLKIQGTTNDSTGIYKLSLAATVKLATKSNPIHVSALHNKMLGHMGVKNPGDSCISLIPKGMRDTISHDSPLPDSLVSHPSCQTEWPEATANVEGTVFGDGNGNGSQDAGENGKEDWLVEITPGPVYATTNSDGDYSASLDTGSYTVSLVKPSYWNVTGTSSYNITISDQADKKTGKDFGVESTSSVEDLSIDITAGIPVAGEKTQNWLSVSNVGTKTKSGTVTFKLDTNHIFQSATPSPKSVSGNTVKWDVNNLKVMENRTISVTSRVEVVPPETPMNSSAKITPKTSDNTPSDNMDSLYQEALSSFDPNDKLASPSRKAKRGMKANYTLMDEELEYTVRFQNTGNYKASKVAIKDTLDENIDVSTFELIGASHEVDYDIKGSGNVTFTFKNINLPDSGSDMQGSKGFVKYSVKAKDDVEEETKVHNDASIYFDYNPAVVTNTTQNTMVNKLPSTSTGISTSTDHNFSNHISPNPFNNNFRVSVEGDKVDHFTFELYNMMGKKLKQKEVKNSRTVDVQADDLPSGMYLYSIELNDGRKSTGKIIAE